MIDSLPTERKTLYDRAIMRLDSLDGDDGHLMQPLLRALLVERKAMLLPKQVGYLDAKAIALSELVLALHEFLRGQNGRAH